MLVLLVAFTAFNLVVAAVSLWHGVRLFDSEARAVWTSKTLLCIAALLSWTFPFAAGACVWLGWTRHLAGAADAVPIVLAPIAWLILLGIIFAVVDFLDDGKMNFGRGAR